MAHDSELILVTGASGYVGSHTVAYLLEQGYRVRAAGRNERTCDKMLSLHSRHGSNIEAIVVPDITAPDAFDEAVRGATGIIHMASPFTYKIEDNERDLIIPAVNGTLGILRSALQSQVKHVVMTASFAAAANFSMGLWPGHVYDETQWNPMTWEDTKNDHLGYAYAGSKKLAEEAAWRFMKDNAPTINFGLSTICPVMIYGPPLDGSISLSHLGQSMTEIYSLINGSRASPPATPMPVFVDVRDVAQAHERALQRGLAATERTESRFLLCGGSFSMDEICRLFRENFPKIKDRVPVPVASEVEHYSVDASRAQKELGITFRTFEDCFLDTARALLELEGV